MKFFACLLIAIVFVNATETNTGFYDKYKNIFSSKRSILSVMVQVENHMKNNGPMDAITNLLDAYVDENMQEQIAHDQLFAAQTRECDSEFEFRDEEVAEANAALDEAEASLDQCTAQKQRAQDDLQESNAQLLDNRLEMSQQLTIKRNYDYGHETFTTVSQMIIKAIDEAFELLDELKNGGQSLVQFTRHITSLAQQSVRVRNFKQMNVVIASMAQLAITAKNSNGQLNDAAIAQVENIIRQYRAQVVESLEQGVADYEQFVIDWTQFMTQLEQEQERLIKLIDDLEFEISELNSCIAVQSSIKMSAEDKVARNQRLWDKAVRMCDAMAKQYHEATESRTDELSLIKAIKVKVQERYGEISEDTTKRGEMTAEEIANSHQSLNYQEREFVYLPTVTAE